jgi:UDP-N-acetylglucosamine 2-epimerase (non-hydrolysing)
MPEEKYRTVADHLSDVIYAYLDEYKEQGLLEGLDARQIVVTGNPIVDVLEHYFLSGRIRMNTEDRSALFTSVGLDNTNPGTFCVMTSHRRENVETAASLRRIMNLAEVTNCPVIFPASYRTQKALARMQISVPENVKMIDPIGYVELLELIDASSTVLTDSGTVVEETAVIGVPSIQMRTSTERPQVYDCGSSVKFDPHLEHSREELLKVSETALSRAGSSWNHGLGDGLASRRIADDLIQRMNDPEKFRGHNPHGTNRPHTRNGGTGLTELGSWF